MMTIDINCDMGEGFGLYKLCNDAEMMPFITMANVACGFHGGDPNHMRATVDLAKKHGVVVGAHPSFPDLQGFGRREMRIPQEELANIIIYQVGALKGFLDAANMPLNHIKPHGALYGMSARQESVAHAIADAAAVFDVPVLGMAGTAQEKVYSKRGLRFISEYYADLDYAPDGTLIITREHRSVDPAKAAARAMRAIECGKVRSVDGTDVDVRAETVCIHSDTPDVLELACILSESLK
jgi:UPF0271 protein